MKDFLWNKLMQHRGHDVDIYSYNEPTGEVVDICLECNTCGCIIIDAEDYELCAKEPENDDK